MVGIIMLAFLVAVVVCYVWRFNQVERVTSGGFWFMMAFSPLLIGLASIAVVWFFHFVGGQYALSIAKAIFWTLGLGLGSFFCFMVTILNYVVAEIDNDL